MFPDKSVLPLVPGEEVVEEAWEAVVVAEVDMVVDQVEAMVVVEAEAVSEDLLTTERTNSRMGKTMLFKNERLMKML